jgi:opacity protein-like surface antigen
MKLLLSLACAGLTAATGAAEAADLFGTAPPIFPSAQASTLFEAGSNWYVRGDLGISFDDPPTLSLSPLATPPAGAPLLGFVSSSSYSTGFIGGAGFGYRWNNYLRFDATWDYSTGPGGNREMAVVCPYGLTGVSSAAGASLGYLYNTSNTCGGSASLRQHNNTFLANAYVDLGTYSGFTPYVGGGVGLNMNSLQASQSYVETASGLPYAADLTSTGAFPSIWVTSAGAPLAPQPNIAFAPQNWNGSISKTTYTFAWALTAGLGYPLTPSATLDVTYRYLNSGAINTLINPETGATVKQNAASQQLLVGIRYVLQ